MTFKVYKGYEKSCVKQGNRHKNSYKRFMLGHNKVINKLQKKELIHFIRNHVIT